MRIATRTIVTLLLLCQASLGWGYPWDQDMVDQPIAKPQRTPAPAGPGSVPVIGGETMPAPTTDVAMDEAKDAAAKEKDKKPKHPFLED